MTNDEAIRKIVALQDGNGDTYEAIRMAIEALEMQETGEWMERFDGNEWFCYCSKCKAQWYEDDLYMGGNFFPRFCPDCGARMV